MARPLIAKGIVELETVVQGIDTKPGIQVQIQTTKGNYACDEVVATFPLGWLKRNKNIFEPRLPNALNNAIDNLGYGCLEKVLSTSLS